MRCSLHFWLPLPSRSLIWPLCLSDQALSETDAIRVIVQHQTHGTIFLWDHSEAQENILAARKVTELTLHVRWSSASICKINTPDSKKLFLNKTQNIEVFPEYVFLNPSMHTGESQLLISDLTVCHFP